MWQFYSLDPPVEEEEEQATNSGISKDEQKQAQYKVEDAD
jgi:hypothetical protein|tara:strand:+ start:1010 stop:1129 length:120 start_codon:yes stop_codon:yes gene_type:complete